MSLSLSSLLNPSPDSDTRPSSPPRKNSLPPLQYVQSPEEQQPHSPNIPRSGQHAFIYPPSTTQEAAQALAALSTSPVAPPGQWNGYGVSVQSPDSNQPEHQRSWERRASGYDDAVTLPPPMSGSARKTFSPTLDQYQVASRSPEQRRASFAPPHESNITLAPIQDMTQSSPQARPPSQPSSHGHVGSQRSPVSASHATDLSVSTQSQPQSQVHEDNAGTNGATTLQTSQPPPPLHLQTEFSTASAPVDDTGIATIKQEAILTPQPSSPTEVRGTPNMEQQTLKAVASLKNEHGLRTQSPLRESSVPVPTTEIVVPEPANPKKRAAPAKTKKGTASAVKREKAPPAKKRKVEPKRSSTPSSRASKAPTAKGASAKGTPINSSPAPSTRSCSADPNEEPYGDEDEEMDDDPDADVYCICRRPDSGTFMIGCDGGCDDWFHGKCVGIEERDKNLIDKYICPNCTKNGVGNTTWKRMCRRSGCRQAAKVGKSKSGTSGSKYCSDDCGVLYFREMVARTRGREENAKSRSSRRKGSMADSEEVHQEDELGARGGVLSAGEVKAMLTVSKTAEEFRTLGDGVLSPPVTPDGQDSVEKPSFTDQESRSLQRIGAEKEESRRRHALLKERMKFVTLVKHAASRVAAEKELKPKEYCGYDSRLEWSEDSFQAWRNSTVGQQAFELDMLQTEKSGDKGQDAQIENGAYDICERKKCARHMDWSKLAVDDIRFEMGDNSDRMRGLDKEEKAIKERSALRAKAGDLSGQGTVEVHGIALGKPIDVSDSTT